ncbi:MAG: MucR family transcriptional regulator [Hyphomicrobiales bacterium]|nr:MucR family transcriptional regulator [Hyphomicrobiales bacterium]MCY4033256.1 MucR family transcriptional regulator [Hyphomicrobiales bacterium]MCY4038864.1 MucR family transcriptional regulator [Hyphomicrobiales bacterium]
MQRTAEIVAAYVINNPVQPEQIPGIIEDTYATLLGLRGQTAEGQTMSQQPAVPIEKSVSPDHITCLECGRKFKSLKGHINQLHGRMTPDEYRKKWGLLPDYPMVAELYAAERSKIAKQVRLEKNVRQET